MAFAILLLSSKSLCFFYFFFFFQAEDGIRDHCVTGVQTCALPIFFKPLVDAYDLLLHGIRGDLQRLENGDSLLVPSLGPVVTVEGMVRRPALYEVRGEKTLEDALDLAGGILPAAALRHIEVQRLVAHEKRTMLSVEIGETSDPDAVNAKLRGLRVQDGDEIHIFPIAPYNSASIYLEGHVLR